MNIVGPKKDKLKDVLIFIKSNLSKLDLKFSKKNHMIYNYKLNPFSYRLRLGKSLKLKKYLNFNKSIKKLIEAEKYKYEKNQ